LPLQIEHGLKRRRGSALTVSCLTARQAVSFGLGSCTAEAEGGRFLQGVVVVAFPIS